MVKAIGLSRRRLEQLARKAELRCAHCGGELEQPTGAGRWKRYCSVSCRTKARIEARAKGLRR